MEVQYLYNSENINTIFELLNKLEVKGLDNAKRIVIIEQLLNNYKVADEDVENRNNKDKDKGD